MASLQARHSRSCANKRPWTTFNDRAVGCTCEPMFHVVAWRGSKLLRLAVGHDPQEARELLREFDREDVVRKQDLRRARIRGKAPKPKASLGHAYIDIRRAISTVDAHIPLVDVDTRAAVRAALLALYDAEDKVAIAMKQAS